MELVNEIVEARNFWEAWMSVRRNKGAGGIDKMSVEALDEYMPLHMDAIKQSICKKQYKPVAYLRYCLTFTLKSSTRNSKVESYVSSVMRMTSTYLSRAKGRRIG